MSDSDKTKGAKSAADITQPKPEIGYRAVGRYFRSPPDKVRIMGRTVIGLQAEKALQRLSLSPNKSARLLWKVINSAAANAQNNFLRDLDRLHVKSIWVDRGAMIKRWHPCAHGRAKPILKRSCHVTVQLEYKG